MSTGKVIRDRREDVIPNAWASTTRSLARIEPRYGRFWQAENTRALAKETLRLIDEASETVLLSSFLLADEEIVQALLRSGQRGVRAYVLVASEQRVGKEPPEDSAFEKETAEAHKIMLDRLAGRVLVRTAESFHAKFLIVDAMSQPEGFLYTCNLTTKALTNPEIAVQLRPAEAEALASFFAWGFWEQAQHELFEAGRLQAATSLGRHAGPRLGDVVHVTGGSNLDLRDAVLRLIRSAKEKLRISTYGFGHADVLEAIQERAKSGVSVEVLVRPTRELQLPFLKSLFASGAVIRGIPDLHAKSIVVDDDRGLVATANLTELGLDEGFEAAVPTKGKDTEALNQLLDSWWSTAPWEFRGDAKVGSLKGQVQIIEGRKIKTFQVVPEVESIRLSRVASSCLSQVDLKKHPAVPPSDPNKVFHSSVYTWDVEEPLLSANARLMEAPRRVGVPSGSQEKPPHPIYIEPGGRRVMALDPGAFVENPERVKKDWGVSSLVRRINHPTPSGGTSGVQTEGPLADTQKPI